MITSNKMIGLTPNLLAPGDAKSMSLDPAAFTWTRIHSTDDPAFERAYSALWGEFGAAHELEAREILSERFRLRGDFCYEMLLVEKDGVFCAVRDHTAFRMDGEIVVHLSHVLVAPEHRRTGLAGWLRTAPIVTARDLASAHGISGADITLVGEMEYDDGLDPKRAIRLAAYERAGYLKLDPVAVRFFQPDFRDPSTIDKAGVSSPLPFQLLVRRIGKEHERSVSGAQVRRIVRAIYAIYAAQLRAAEMKHPLLNIERYPADAAVVSLVLPTAPSV